MSNFTATHIRTSQTVGGDIPAIGIPVMYINAGTNGRGFYREADGAGALIADQDVAAI